MQTQAAFSCFILGSTTLPLQCAKILVDNGHEICGIISDDEQIAPWAQENNIPHFSGDSLAIALKDESFDYLFTIVSDIILPPEILSSPREFAVNYHDGPLPRYAGMHVTTWAILNQETRHAVTWHRMTEHVDAGDILKHAFVDIAPNDTALTLNAKCYEAAIHSFAALVDDLSQNKVTGISQDLTQRSYFGRYQRPPAACVIDWQQGARKIDALVRSLDFGSYPNPMGLPKLLIGDDAFVIGKLGILETNSQVDPGTIVAITPDSLIIATPTQDVALQQLAMFDGQIISSGELAARFDLRKNDTLLFLEPELCQRLTETHKKTCRHEEFWRARLTNLQPVSLPYISGTATLHESVQSAEYTRRLMPVSVSVSDDFLLTTFAVLLARLNQLYHFDLIFSYPGLHSTVRSLEAIFASHIPLRINIDETQTFETARQAVRAEIALLGKHHTYIHDIVLRYPEFSANPELRLSIAVEIVEQTADFQPIPGAHLTFGVTTDGTTCCWLYDTSILSQDEIDQLVHQFETLLDSIVSQPEQAITTLPLLTSAEQQQILMAWNKTKADYPHDKSLVDLFETQAVETPHAVAVVFENEYLTYQVLNNRANQVAHYLQTLGVGPDVLVGIFLDRSLDMVVGMLGILKAGGAYVPLDPTYPPERLAFIIEDMQAPVLLTQEKFAGELSKQAARVVCFDAEANKIGRTSKENPTSDIMDGNLAYVIFTSGSTGRPKGVQISHRSVVNFLHAMRRSPGFTAQDVLLSVTTLSFDISVLEVFLPLIVGGRVVLAGQNVAVDGVRLLALLNNCGATVMQATPATWQMLLAVGWSGSPRLKILCGGEALPGELAAQLLERGALLWNLYGPTETTIWSSLYLVQPTDAKSETTISIGRPIANTQMYILDRHLQPLPPGLPGELYIGGDGLARGYLNRPELNREKFIPHPFSDQPGTQLYKTGDLARYRSDGNIEYLGRLDHQVKVRGFRIELGEIEAVLAQHPAVRQAVVVAREDRPGDRRLVAYVTKSKQIKVDTKTLHHFLQQKLPEYMLPSAFVFLDVLPLTPNNKIDRRALPPPAAGGADRTTDFVAPRNPVEEILAGLWTQVLKVEQIGIHDNFFELGGHSLLAVQLTSRIEKTFRIPLSLRDLFELPTIAALAEVLADKEQGYAQAQTGIITLVDRAGPLPLSFAQQRLWFLDQFEPDNPVYNISIAVRLTGRLKLDALNDGLSELVRRHESLRSTFAAEMGQPVQVINPAQPVTISVVDLHHLSRNARETEAQCLAQAEARSPFDLAVYPLWRVKLLRLDGNEHVLVFIIHHIIADDWSITIFIRELAAFYQARSAGISANLPELPVQYPDFAHWQSHHLQGDVLENQLTYWRQKLAHSPPVLNLPANRPRPSVQSYRGARHIVYLPASLSQNLQSLSQQENSTLFMVLLTAFKVLLYRYTNQKDIAVGSPIANRRRVELEGLIGLFVNTLVLRTSFTDESTFLELLQQVRETALEAYEHQDLPFETLVDALQPERDLRYPPLFQVMFVLQVAADIPDAMADLKFTIESVENSTAKFDLTLELKPGADGLTCMWEYNTDLFDGETIVRMAGHFQILLENIVTDPDQSIAMLPILSKEERRQLLYDWNDTKTNYSPDQCLHQLFETQVAENSEATAVVFEEQRLSYGELNERANQLARHLQTLGVGPDVLVGICIERSLEMVVGLLGVLKAGGAYVPLDPTYPKERLAFMIEDAQVPVLLTQSKLVSELPAQQAQILCLDKDWDVVSRESKANVVNNVVVENLAYVIYTSGSTGKPKGVMMPHRAICNHMIWMQSTFPLTEADKVLQKTPFSFDASIWEFYAPLLVGAQLIMAQPEGHQDSAYLVNVINQQKVTILQLVPSLLQLLLETDDFQACRSLKRVFCGGEPLSADLRDRFFANLDAELHNLYGPTEACIDATFWRCHRESREEIVPIGRPISNTQAYILNNYLQPVPIGVSGELHLGGLALARGYLNRPQLTAEKFIPHPFADEPGARLYKTGDLARYLPDGSIEFLGRIDHQVKIRGFRIELGEIEAVLKQHHAVQESAVLAHQDRSNHKRLVAYIVPAQILEQEKQALPADLRQFIRAKLPNYMIPAVFILLDNLPLTPNGKIDRRALPTPDSVQIERTQTLIAPATPAEKTLAEIWMQVLGLDQIGIHDNFFELGGDSILSIQIIVRAKQAGLHLTSKQLFQYQTIAELASVAGTISTGQIEQGPVTGPVPITPIQHWFFEQNFPEPHYWNQSMLVELRQSIDDDLLKQITQHLLIHHDALRLRFEPTESGWRQTNAAPDNAIPFSRLDLSGLSKQEQQAALEANISDLQAGLNLTMGPLMRLAYFDLGPSNADYLFIVIHHLAVDGVSWRILLEDIATIYRQLSRNEPVLLPPKTTSYQHWGEALAKYSKSKMLQQEANHWFEIVRAKTSHLPLDFSANTDANTEASVCTVTVQLGVDDTSALLQVVPAVYQTRINDILLTALLQAFAGWTGDQILLLDLEGHGREEIVDGVDLGRTVGWFTTIFPVILKLEYAANPGNTLEAVKEQLRSIPQHGIGYGLLRYLGDDPTLAEKLIIQPQVAFNYLGQFDQTFASGSLFKMKTPAIEAKRSPLVRRRHVLSVDGYIAGGQLRVEWTYSKNLHQSETIEKLAQSFVEALRTLIGHCQSLVVAGDDWSRAIVSHQIADSNQPPLPLARVELPAAVRANLPENIEDAYPLAEMQALMLRHANHSQEAGVYHIQQSFHLQDDTLLLKAFKQALRNIVARHPALRTTFKQGADGELFQVVNKTLPFTIEERDICDLTLAEQATYVAALMQEDHAKPFNFEKDDAPLFRFLILMRSETAFEFFMSIHHSITDGWGNTEFFNELFTDYTILKRGESVDVAPAATNVYKEFVALEKETIASEEARAFWFDFLQSSQPQFLKPKTSPEITATRGLQTLIVENDLISGLQSIARQLKVSLRAVFLSAYLDLIAAETGEPKVTIGVVANGRSDRLSDPLKALGLFWYMIPFFHNIDPMNKIVQIKCVQNNLLALEPYIGYPLNSILADQQQAELFFATLNFVHFHNIKHASAISDLKILGRKERDKFHFPLNTTVSVNLLDRETALKIEYDERYFTAKSITAIVKQYLTILEHLVFEAGNTPKK